MSDPGPSNNVNALLAEIKELRSRLNETEETLKAIRNGEVDAIIVSGENGEKVFSLASSETPYRTIIEVMEEGAVNVTSKGIILYSNHRFSEIVSTPLEKISGSDFTEFISESDRPEFRRLLRTSLKHPVRGEVSSSLEGKTTHLRLSMVPLPEQMEGGACIVVSDITEIHNFQNYLQEMVDERTSKLKTANKQLSTDLTRLIKTEKALMASEERYSLAIQAANMGTWDHIYTEKGILMTWSDLMLKLFGFPYGTMITPGMMIERIDPSHRECVSENLRQAIEDHIAYDCEYSIIWPDNSMHWIHVTGRSTYDENTGRILRMNGIALDITDNRKAEEELKKSEERYRLLSDTMLQGVIYRDVEGKVISINPAGERILGIKAEEIIGHHSIPAEFNSIREDGTPFPENEHPSISALRSSSPSTGVVMGIYNRTEKNYRWIRIDTMPLIRMGEDHPYQVYSMFEDITSRKLAESKMLRSEELFRSAFDEGAVPMCLTSTDGHFLRVNRSFSQLTGYSEKELLEMSFQDLTYSDDLEVSEKGRIDLLTGEKSSFRIEKRYVRKNGKIIWVSLSSAPVRDEKGKLDFFVGHIQDINKRKNAENRLRESKERFKQLANSIPQLAWISRSDGYIFWFNQRWYEYTGKSPEQVIGWGWQSVHNLKTFPGLMKLWKGYINAGKPFELVTSLMGKDGNYSEFLTKSIPIKDKSGNIEQWFGTHTDISELKKVEKELKGSKEKLNIALENGNIGTWEWNLKTNEIIWDERTEKMFGLLPGTFEGTYTAFESYIHEEDIPHVRKALDDTIASGQPFETIYRTRPNNGVSNYISAKALLNYDNHGKPLSMAGVFFDVTDMKKGAEQVLIKLNEELLRSNTDLQQFAYVASHDLQEPLRMVSSFTQLLKQRYQDKLGNDGNDYIRFAVEGSKRMYDLLNGLLTYSRIQTRGKDFEKVDLNEVLDKVKENLSLMIEETKAVINSKNLPVIFADESQMIQLIQNLIENGLKFRREAPDITISSILKNEDYIFSVKDKGIGIEPQYFERIFKIFQRLHRIEEYEGTGIGLAICRRIVERHGGRIWVESKYGSWTTFYFTIPQALTNSQSYKREF